MNHDEEEFFDLVSSCRGCEKRVFFSVFDKKTGETILADISVRCGMLWSDDITGPVCVACGEHVRICDCGMGIPLGTTEPSVPVCSGDAFCRHEVNGEPPD